MTTIYTQLQESGITFTHGDCGRIGEVVFEKYFAKFATRPAKKSQHEGANTYWVFSYPEDFIVIIQESIADHFVKKLSSTNIDVPVEKKEKRVVIKKRPRIKK